MSARDNLRLGGGSVDAAARTVPGSNRDWRSGVGCSWVASNRCWRSPGHSAASPRSCLPTNLPLGLAPQVVDRLLGAVRSAADERGTGALIVEQHAHKALKYADRMYLQWRPGQILMVLPAAEAIGRLDEIEDAYLRGTSETEEDHIERKRRKDKKAMEASACARAGVGTDQRKDRLHQEGRR